MEKSGSITCAKEGGESSARRFRRQRLREPINLASSCHLVLERSLIGRAIDLDRPIYLTSHRPRVTLYAKLENRDDCVMADRGSE